MVTQGAAMYNVNDKVVYPGHGVAIINKLIEKQVASQTIQFFELSFLSKEITVMVPVSNLTTLGLRPLATQKEIKTLLEDFCMEQKKVLSNDTAVNSWNKRNKNFQAKLKTGFLKDLASIYLELKNISNYKELSFGERSVLQQTERLLAEEISIVMNISAIEAAETLCIHAAQNINIKETTVLLNR